MVAFDLLSLNGEDLRQRPLEEGRAELSRLVAGVDNIVFGEALVAEGALVFARACELGLEGIVSKRAGSRYSSGNSRQWLKSITAENMWMAGMLKGFGRRPLARRLGEPPGAGVRKPRKEETAGRKGAVW